MMVVVAKGGQQKIQKKIILPRFIEVTSLSVETVFMIDDFII